MTKMKSKNMKDAKSDSDSFPIENSPQKINSHSNRNGLLCPKSVRNHLKKTQKSKEKHTSSDKEDKETSKSSKDVSIPKFIKKSVTKVSDNEIVTVSKINNENVDWPLTSIKHTDTKPSLIYSYNPSLTESQENNIDSKYLSKIKKKKKHLKSKIHDTSDNEGTNSLKKLKKNRKSKKKKNKISDEILDKEIKKEEFEIDGTTGSKKFEIPKSFLVSYSSDEDDMNGESTFNKKSPEVKSELKCNLSIPINKCENKIEIKLKPTKSPGKSAWESSESELEAEPKKGLKEMKVSQVKSPNIVKSPQVKKSKSKSKSAKSKTHSLNGTHSTSRSVSHSSYSSSRSASYSDNSGRSSRSYSRSRSHSKSKRHSRRRRHYSSSSSSYSRSRSRYHSRSSTRSTSYSRSSRSYSRSRSRYKSSYSSRYRSRSRSRSSRSRSNSYYRSSYRKRKRSSSTDRFLNVPTRKVKTAPFRNSVLQGGPPKYVDIGKKIDAIKESQRKILENQNSENVPSLNIPLPPEKPKVNLMKIGDSYSNLDLIGPVAKKSKKNNIGNKNSSDLKTCDKADNNQLQYFQSSDYNYIGPQVSSDMAKRLGLDVKSNITKKENVNDNFKTEPLTSDSFIAPTLDAAHMALQSRAYQHRLYNLQGSNNQDIAAQAQQYYHPLYMSASSLSNNLTALASAAVANEQLPASVAGSLAQAAVQRIMSSSNLTATYNTPSVMTSPGAASLQTALHNGLPSSCGTFVANTPTGLIPISLLQQGGFQIGINPLVLQQLQQQAFSAQFGQAMALPNQHILSNVNQFLLQAQNQQALLQSLGVNAQAQLLGSPLNLQHSLLMAAQQQQQQQQLLAAAQINQATLQAAHLQAHIQAQARAVSLQNLQQAAQMQSSAQNASSISMPAVMTDSNEDIQKHDNVDQMLTDNVKANIEGSSYIYSDQNFYNEINSMQLSESAVTSNDEANVVPVNVNETHAVQYTMECDNIGTSDYNTIVKQQAPRIIYSSPAVIESVNISSPVLKP